MKHNEIGKIGEKIAENYLKRYGYSFIDRNYLKKYGEIDLVMKKNNRVHFIEVKSVSYETLDKLPRETQNSVSHETWRPEDNVDKRKLQKLSRVIEVWLEENNYEEDWQLDVVTVRINTEDRKANIKIIPDVII